MSKNSCHFVNLLSFASSSFFLSMKKITWLNSQQPKTREHVDHPNHLIIRLELHKGNWKYCHNWKSFMGQFLKHFWIFWKWNYKIWTGLELCFSNSLLRIFWNRTKIADTTWLWSKTKLNEIQTMWEVAWVAETTLR